MLIIVQIKKNVFTFRDVLWTTKLFFLRERDREKKREKKKKTRKKKKVLVLKVSIGCTFGTLQYKRIVYVSTVQSVF